MTNKSNPITDLSFSPDHHSKEELERLLQDLFAGGGLLPRITPRMLRSIGAPSSTPWRCVTGCAGR